MIQSSLLHILQHTYWDKKAVFQLDEDLYEQWVVFVIEEGSFEYEIEKEKGTATFGDLIFCPPHTFFKRRVIKPLTFHFIRFSCSEFLQEACPPAGKITIKDTDRLRSSTGILKGLAYDETPQSNSWRSHFLIDLWQLYSFETSTLFVLDKKKKWSDQLMASAQDYITKHALESDIQIKTVASKFGLSPVQFTRRFHAAFKMSPSEYLTSIRIRKAQTLLLETNNTIEDVADKCGYSNGFYFSRRFTEKMNVSPSEFRKNNKV